MKTSMNKEEEMKLNEMEMADGGTAQDFFRDVAVGAATAPEYFAKIVWYAFLSSSSSGRLM